MDAGPRVMPGTYLVELTTGTDVVQTEVVVRLDPRVELARRPMQTRHLAMLESYRISGPLSDAEDAVEAMHDAVDELEALVSAEDQALNGQITTVREELDALADDLDDASLGAGIWRAIQSVTGPASADQLWMIEHSWEVAPAVISRVNQALTGTVPTLLRLGYTDAAMPALPDPVATAQRGG
jgi:hypothetical protein